jgi:hypothetical protein
MPDFEFKRFRLIFEVDLRPQCKSGGSISDSINSHFAKMRAKIGTHKVFIQYPPTQATVAY